MAQEKAVAKSAAGNRYAKAAKTYFKENLGIILAFCRKYFASFVVIAAGTASYMKAAGYIVGEITKVLGGNGGGKPQMAQGMGKTQKGIEDILLKIEQDILNSLAQFGEKMKKL